MKPDTHTFYALLAYFPTPYQITTQQPDIVQYYCRPEQAEAKLTRLENDYILSEAKIIPVNFHSIDASTDHDISPELWKDKAAVAAYLTHYANQNPYA